MKTLPLQDVARFVRGVTFKPTDLSAVGVGVMRTKNVQETLDLSDILRVPARLVKRDEQYLRPGDILVSSANSWYAVGRACWVPKLPEPLAIGGFVTALRPSSASIEPRYLYRWFSSPRTQAVLRSLSNKTTNISNLNLTLAARMSVPVPPLEEQRRIAAILDYADALRAKRRRVLAHTGALSKAIFQDMFGDVSWTSSLGELAEVQIGPFGSLLHQEDYVSGGVAVLNPIHIRDGRLQPDELFSVSEDKAASLSPYRLRTGDVVLGRRGEMGRAGVAKADHDGMLCGTGSVILRPRGVQSTFLHAVVTSTRMKDHLERSSLGATLPNLNAGIVKASPAPSAPMAAQLEFDDRVSLLAAAKARSAKVRATEDELFVSLQSRAFRGEM